MTGRGVTVAEIASVTMLRIVREFDKVEMGRLADDVLLASVDLALGSGAKRETGEGGDDAVQDAIHISQDRWASALVDAHVRVSDTHTGDSGKMTDCRSAALVIHLCKRPDYIHSPYCSGRVRLRVGRSSCDPLTRRRH